MSSLSGSTGSTFTTAHCLDGFSGTHPTASWVPSLLFPSWSPSSWQPWWCGGANAVRELCSEGEEGGLKKYILALWSSRISPQWPKELFPCVLVVLVGSAWHYWDWKSIMINYNHVFPQWCLSAHLYEAFAAPICYYTNSLMWIEITYLVIS